MVLLQTWAICLTYPYGGILFSSSLQNCFHSLTFEDFSTWAASVIYGVYSDTELLVRFRSLSCCKTKVCFIFSSLVTSRPSFSGFSAGEQNLWFHQLLVQIQRWRSNAASSFDTTTTMSVDKKLFYWNAVLVGAGYNRIHTVSLAHKIFSQKSWG